MKKLLKLSLVFFISFSTVQALELPVGQYEFISSKISFVKDVRVLNIRYRDGQLAYQKLKEQNYTCGLFPNMMAKCHKFLRQRDIVKIPLEEVLSLTPNFDEDFKFDLVSESDYLSIYDIEQNSNTYHHKAQGSRLYQRNNGIHHLDIRFGEKTFRYNYKDTSKLSLQLIKRKSYSRSHWLEFGVLTIYDKVEKF